jgi:hypothetical protein
MLGIPSPYLIIGGIIVGALVIGGTYFYGYRTGSKVTKAEYETVINNYVIEKQNLQLAFDKEKNSIKEKVVTEYVDRVQKIKEMQVVYRDRIREVPSMCEVSKGWVYVHDQAVTGAHPEVDASANPDLSGVKDTDVLGVVTDNYSTCREKDAQIKAWQDYFARVKQAVENANKNVKNRPDAVK